MASSSSPKPSAILWIIVRLTVAIIIRQMIARFAAPVAEQKLNKEQKNENGQYEYTKPKSPLEVALANVPPEFVVEIIKACLAWIPARSE